jgi:chemotaxis protein methyltransferase CheR
MLESSPTPAVRHTAAVEITDAEFELIRKLLHRRAGVTLSPVKKALVTTRLGRRLRHLGLSSYRQYAELLDKAAHAEELQTALNLLTTHETSFFREPAHFDFLLDCVLPQHPAGRPFRVWSAACSTGEEPYTIAMVLAASAVTNWELIASDISTDSLEAVRAGHYPISRAQSIPREHLQRYCLKGTGPYAGSFLIERSLRQRVQSRQVNINEHLPPGLGPFDVIFLRNVMIYFDQATKAAVIGRLVQVLQPGGYLMIGHCENLNGIPHPLMSIRPAIFRKPLP